MGYKQSWAKSWLEIAPNAESNAKKAIERLSASLSSKRPINREEALAYDIERGKALVGLRSALDALSVDFALERYNSGEYTMKEVAELLGTNHPTIVRWKKEIESFM